MEKAQNAVLSMMLSCAGTAARGAKLKLLGIETMEARRELLQFQFFNRLDKSVPMNVPASTLWHSSACTGPLGRTRMQSSAVTNPIIRFSHLTITRRRLLRLSDFGKLLPLQPITRRIQRGSMTWQQVYI